MTKPKHAWMVRAGNDNELAPYVGKEDVVAVSASTFFQVRQTT